MEINYPERGFWSTATRALLDGKDLVIKIHSGWRGKLIKNEFQKLLPRLPEEYNKKMGGKVTVPPLKIFLLMPALASIHNSAMVCKYSMRVDVLSDGVQVTYSAPVLPHPTLQ